MVVVLGTTGMSSSMKSMSYQHGRLFGIAECMLGRLAVLSASASVALLLGAGLAIAQGTPAPPPQAEQPARFKSAVDLVSVSAVVKDKKGRFVQNLSRDDFI